MRKYRKHKYIGRMVTTKYLSNKFGITSKLLLQRLKNGWYFSNDKLVPESFKKNKKGPRDSPISSVQYKELQEGFAWDEVNMI